MRSIAVGRWSVPIFLILFYSRSRSLFYADTFYVRKGKKEGNTPSENFSLSKQKAGGHLL